MKKISEIFKRKTKQEKTEIKKQKKEYKKTHKKERILKLIYNLGFWAMIIVACVIALGKGFNMVAGNLGSISNTVNYLNKPFNSQSILTSNKIDYTNDFNSFATKSKACSFNIFTNDELNYYSYRNNMFELSGDLILKDKEWAAFFDKILIINENAYNILELNITNNTIKSVVKINITSLTDNSDFNDILKEDFYIINESEFEYNVNGNINILQSTLKINDLNEEDSKIIKLFLSTMILKDNINYTINNFVNLAIVNELNNFKVKTCTNFEIGNNTISFKI